MKATHSYYMREALKEARKAFERDEVPVGAVIVHKDTIIARACNQILTLKDPTAHAEMIAITQAADYLRNERLINCTLYATIEPCAMCAGAIVQARIPLVVFGAFDEKAGAAGSLMNLLADIRLNHQPEVISGFMVDESRRLMRAFFQQMRDKFLRRGG